jgi:hypothetical protein
LPNSPPRHRSASTASMAPTAGRGKEGPRAGRWRPEPAERAASMPPKRAHVHSQTRCKSTMSTPPRTRGCRPGGVSRPIRAGSAALAVYCDAAFETTVCRRLRFSMLSPVSRDPGGGRMVGRGCPMRVQGFVAASSDGLCDSWPTRPAGGLVARADADGLGCVARGDAAALNMRGSKPPGARSSWRGAVLWWNARCRSTTAWP